MDNLPYASDLLEHRFGTATADEHISQYWRPEVGRRMRIEFFAKGLFVMLKSCRMNSKKRKWAWLTIVPIVLLVTAFTSNKHTLRYNPAKICDDSFRTRIDHFNDNLPGFTIDMPEGCFGALIRVPKEWKTVWYQSEGDTKDWWVSFWLTGEPNAIGPFNGNSSQHWDVAGKWFRLQGHGKIKFYSNDSTPK